MGYTLMVPTGNFSPVHIFLNTRHPSYLISSAAEAVTRDTPLLGFYRNIPVSEGIELICQIHTLLQVEATAVNSSMQTSQKYKTPFRCFSLDPGHPPTSLPLRKRCQNAGTNNMQHSQKNTHDPTKQGCVLHCHVPSRPLTSVRWLL